MPGFIGFFRGFGLSQYVAALALNHPFNAPLKALYPYWIAWPKVLFFSFLALYLK